MIGRLVYNNQGSKPLAGVLVQLKNLTGVTLASDTTDSIGFYALGGIANGTYRLDAVLNGGMGVVPMRPMPCWPPGILGN